MTRIEQIRATVERLEERLALLEYSDSIDRASRIAELKREIAALGKEIEELERKPFIADGSDGAAQ